MMSLEQLIDYLRDERIGVHCPTRDVRRALRNAIVDTYQDVDTHYIDEEWNPREYPYLIGSALGHFALAGHRENVISPQEFISLITCQDEISPISLEGVL